MNDLEVGAISEALGKPTACGTSRAKPGWFCSRHVGHEGPCAAHQVTPGARTEIKLEGDTAQEVWSNLLTLVTEAYAESRSSGQFPVYLSISQTGFVRIS